MRSRKTAVLLLAYGLVALVLILGVRWVRPVRVAGGSMSPALRAGDLVLVGKGNPHVDDIILFSEPGKSAVLHRVVALRPDGLVTRGDANPTNDRTRASADWVTGVVKAVIPVGKLLERVAAIRALR